MWQITFTASGKLTHRHHRVISRQNEAVTRASSSLLFFPWKSSSCRRTVTSFEAGNLHQHLTLSDRRDNRRFLSSTTRYKQHPSRNNSKQGEINHRIVAFGKKNDWTGILDLYEKEKEQFNHVNYATSMSQLGKIISFRRYDRRLEAMMIDIASQLQNSKAGSWGAQGMANVLHAVAKMQLKSNGTRLLTDSMLGEANFRILVENANHIEIANTAWACATLGVKCPTLFKAIDHNATFIVEKGNAQAIANIAWACATLRVECHSLFKAIDHNATFFVENGNAQAIANTAWACATLGVECHSLFKAIDNNALYLVESGKTQAIANMAWACATLAIECPTLFKAIDSNALYLVENGNSQDVGNTAWACATLGVECPSWFKAVDNNAMYFVENGTSQNIANTAWACATLGVQCPSLFKAIDNHALHLVENGTSQDIANTAWSCATLSVKCPSLFNIIDNNALYIVENGNAQAIANTVWACATLGVECPTLFKAIDDNALNLVENGTGQNIANMAWSCATLRVECPTFFKTIDDHALYIVENGTGQAVANTAWACATLGVECPSLFKAIGSHMESVVESCNALEIAILCYSFAVLDFALDHEAKFRILWNRAIILKLDLLNIDISRQILQTFVVVSRVMELPPPTEVLKHFGSLSQHENHDSSSQREMSQLLIEMGVSHEMEASPFPTHAFVPGFLAIDAACMEHRLAIEFDGPSHFLQDVSTGKWLEGRVEDGRTKAKRRFLERLGWKVVNVRYWEWASANSKDEKLQLLAAKLQDVKSDISLTQMAKE